VLGRAWVLVGLGGLAGLPPGLAPAGAANSVAGVGGVDSLAAVAATRELYLVITADDGSDESAG